MSPHFPRRSPPASLPSRPPLRSARLLDQLRERVRYSLKTEKSYTHVLASSAAGLASPLDALRCEEPRPASLH